MKNHKVRNSLLALTGLVALTIYVLACGTAFSPDDAKVLYPAFDKENGQVGLAVYDRKARVSQMLFVPASIEDGERISPNPRILRGHWLPDGRTILAAWPGIKDNDDDGLSLAVLPVEGRGTFRLYQLPNVDEAAAWFTMPLPLVGNRVFIRLESNQVARLDLKTGTLVTAAVPGLEKDGMLYPSPRGDTVFCVLQEEDSDGPAVFARLDPNTFKTTPILTITNEVADSGFFAFNNTGRRFAIVEEIDGALQLNVLEGDRTVFSRPLGNEQGIRFGNALFSPGNDAILASFQRRESEVEGASYGIMEIPLDQRPIRETVLVPACSADEEEDAMMFQVSLSHDGETAAAASTYLACEDEAFKAENCALFLVDLKDPKRKVTRVPIPLPPNRKSAVR